MINTPVRFHNCDDEILKIGYRIQKINPVPKKSFAHFRVPFVFWKLECGRYSIKNVRLKCKSKMKVI